MIETNTVCGKTEIYANGGVSTTYLTEAKTTMFHNFWTRKILGEGETPEDFIEVSEAQKTAFEKAAAAWTRPPQVFIDFWNAACYKDGVGAANKNYEVGRYNEETGYFELNNLKDITYIQALKIAKCSYYGAMAERGDAKSGYFASNNDANTWKDPRVAAFARTYFPINTLAYTIDTAGMFAYNNVVESVRFFGGYGEGSQHRLGVNSFIHCEKLRFVIGITAIMNDINSSVFGGCSALEDVMADRIFWAANIWLGDSPKFSRARLLSWASKKPSHDKICTITVHPSIYSKIIDENNEEWHAIYLAGINHNIAFAQP